MNILHPSDQGKKIWLGPEARYAVYGIHLDNVLYYVGWCQRSVLFDLSPLNAVPGYALASKAALDIVHLELLGFYRFKEVALKAVSEWRLKLQPVNRAVQMGRGIVRCDQDGKTYANSSQAAQAYGISASAMSNHLRGRKGYERVHGLTFTREYGNHGKNEVMQYRDKNGKYHAVKNGQRLLPAMPVAATPPEPDTFDSNAGMDAIEASIMRQMRDTFKNG